MPVARPVDTGICVNEDTKKCSTSWHWGQQHVPFVNIMSRLDSMGKDMIGMEVQYYGKNHHPSHFLVVIF
jgi:hypothetical protein